MRTSICDCSICVHVMYSKETKPVPEQNPLRWFLLLGCLGAVLPVFVQHLQL